ncbi:hypothetical protein Q3G72_027656 [Acer saccharum]|nr:hypothetical protein Q3G72_027656 [Acer saccharum]
MNLQQLTKGDPNGKTIYIKLAASEFSRPKKHKETVIGVAVGSAALVLLLFLVVIVYLRRKKRTRKTEKAVEGSLVAFAYKDLQNATKNFSEKLGAGGRRNCVQLEDGEMNFFPTWAVNRIAEGGDILSLLDKRLESNADVEEISRMLKVACWCIQDDENHRPSMGQVVQMLEGIVDVTQPPVPRLTQGGRFGYGGGIEKSLLRLFFKGHSHSSQFNHLGWLLAILRNLLQFIMDINNNPWWLMFSVLFICLSLNSHVSNGAATISANQSLSGRRNCEQSEDGEVNFFPTWAVNQIAEGGDILSLLDHRLESNADVEELSRMLKVACWCIQDDENHRPSMGQVVQMLEGIVDVTQPPVPRSLRIFVDNQEHIIFFTESSS